MTALLHQGTSVRVRVTGASMAPLIRSGDTVTVAPVKERIPDRGDLILFVNRCGAPVLHRIVKIADTGTGTVYRTKGDAQGMFDEPVAHDAVLGRVVRIARRRRGLCGADIDLDAPFWQRIGPLLAAFHLLVNRFWCVAIGRKAGPDRETA